MIAALIVPLVGILVGVFVLARGTLLTRGSSRTYAQYQAGQLAWQLGLDLVEGDPATNLGVRIANPEMRRGHSPAAPLHVRVRLSGSPQGVPVELYYEYREQTTRSLGSVTREEQSACRMTALAGQPFPPFEVMSRKVPHGSIDRLQELPTMSTGRPGIDATYLVATSAPAMAELLGELLEGFAPLAASGVHLVGDGQRVAFVMRHKGFPFLRTSLDHAVTMRDQLTALAQRLGG
ncbi:hypothetical protein P3T36_004234 [Kitasatospora sp. MAP12-15]|uniref:hypothetical protein n=1 Tax=unclassified Kitasatospora TaxID=2633591 RepID=UPI002476D47F|nr:hypothetical protein [Kitasatospora sp. MAP12-44]MDH6108301.1 hypothetical protein [Kitasatospora sp. MAP12-44]